MLPIPFIDLESALYWVSGSVAFDNAAYISKATGQVFYASKSHDVEDELPEDVDDASAYWSVPHKNDLDLGRDLVYRFAQDRLPGEFRCVREMFHHRGAYARFKDLLQRTGQIEAWHAYENAATRTALLAWAEEQGMPVAVG